MGPNKTVNLPTMLMLCDCFPAPGVGERAERAWRLLNCASTTHQVYLAALADQPINLTQWRQTSGLAHRVYLELGKLRRSPQPPIGGEAGNWLRTRRFDALVVTSPRIWPSGGVGFAEYSLCDFTNDLEPRAPGSPGSPSSPGSPDTLGGWFTRLAWPLHRQRALRAKAKRSVTGLDHAIVANEGQAARLKTQGSPTIVIPNHTAAEDAWTRLFHSVIQPRLTPPAVTVMPVKPQHIPARKAA